MKGLQLYTVRSCMTDSISAENTIKRIAEMGYESVQLAGSIEDVELIADVCARLKMPCIGILVGIDLCENYTERLFKCARLVGASDIGISSSAKNAEMAESIIKRANAFAKIAKSEGFTFSYHNHSNEFIRTENGKTVMELFIGQGAYRLYARHLLASARRSRRTTFHWGKFGQDQAYSLKRYEAHTRGSNFCRDRSGQSLF